VLHSSQYSTSVTHWSASTQIGHPVYPSF
jgi:hypothetical protein